MSGETRVAAYGAVATLGGASALVPLYAGVPWLWPAAGAVLAVVAAAGVARRLRAPRALVLLAGLAGLVLTLTAGWARADAPLGVLPGSAALAALRALLQHGLADAARLAAPVPPTPGLRLLAVGGVGLVALAVDAVAVTWRRPALAGLPLLALFAVPAAVLPGGPGLLPFLLGASGYLALLLAAQRERLGGWGRTLGPGPADRRRPMVATAPLAALGSRVGALAIGLAIAVPSLVPGLETGWRAGGEAGGLGAGGGRTIVVVNPIVDLKRDLTAAEPVEVMRVRTTDPEPEYLRMLTLDVFDGVSWRQSRMTAARGQRVTRGMPAPVGLDASQPVTRVTTRVAVTRLDVPWLPLPYPATAVGVAGDWRYDRASRVVFSTRATTRGLSYRVVSWDVRPRREALDSAPPPAGLDRYLVLPPDLPQVVPELAADITSDATTPYRRAVALQDWFRTTFAYDLSVAAGNGNDALLAFLEDRRGYCEQFAASMALMARTLGIPARVAIGFTPGVRTSSGTWSVTTRDAHAWPELFFPGVGWTRFEPTPLGDGRASVPAYSVPSFVGGTPSGLDSPTASGAPSPSTTADQRADRVAGNRDDRDARTTSGTRGRGLPPVLPAVAVVALVVLVVPATVDRVARRLRWSRARSPAEEAHAGWVEVQRAATDFGFAAVAADSPRAAGARLAATAGLDAAATAALARLARCEELARYARTPPPQQPAAGRRDAVTVRRALGRRVGRRRRWRALVCPPSLFGDLRAMAAAGRRGPGRRATGSAHS